MAAWPALAGAALVGYGALVLAGVLAHEAPWTGLAAIAGGAAALLWPRPGGPARHSLPGTRATALAVLGLGLAGAVAGYNLLRGSDVSWPEAALLGYGLALAAASRVLDARVAGRVEVATLVGWSFPLLLAPFALYALNGVLGEGMPAPASAVIEATLVAPLAGALGLLGDPVRTAGPAVLLPTARGTLTLGVGLVCAGLYPAVMFLGALGLHGWQHRLAAPRLAGYLALGLLGLWAANVLRLVVLAKVGQAWGAEALQLAHEHAGWLLFLGFMGLFWGLVLRPVERGAGVRR